MVGLARHIPGTVSWSCRFFITSVAPKSQIPVARIDDSPLRGLRRAEWKYQGGNSNLEIFKGVGIPVPRPPSMQDLPLHPRPK